MIVKINTIIDDPLTEKSPSKEDIELFKKSIEDKLSEEKIKLFKISIKKILSEEEDWILLKTYTINILSEEEEKEAFSFYKKKIIHIKKEETRKVKNSKDECENQYYVFNFKNLSEKVRQNLQSDYDLVRIKYLKERLIRFFNESNKKILESSWDSIKNDFNELKELMKEEYIEKFLFWASEELKKYIYN